jgi:hypothetical protein
MSTYARQQTLDWGEGANGECSSQVAAALTLTCPAPYQMYLMPEGSKSGQLRLYTTSTFPTGWTLDTVLVEAPLVDASLVPPAPGVAYNDGRYVSAWLKALTLAAV